MLRAEPGGVEELADRPRVIEKQVFGEILHCALDDPWRGLSDGPFGGGAYGGCDRIEAPTAPR